MMTIDLSKKENEHVCFIYIRIRSTEMMDVELLTGKQQCNMKHRVM